MGFSCRGVLYVEGGVLFGGGGGGFGGGRGLLTFKVPSWQIRKSSALDEKICNDRAQIFPVRAFVRAFRYFNVGRI